MSRQPGEVFDTASEYDARIRALIADYEALHGALLFSARSFQPDAQSILELGVGTGNLTEALLDAFPDAYIVGVDYSSQMLEFAKDHLVSDRVRFVEADMMTIPDALGFDGNEGSFNVVASAFAIHHLDLAGKADLFSRVHTLLDDGGLFLNVDRIRPATETERLLHEAHFAHHMLNSGFSAEEVLERRFSREEADQPSTIDEQLDALRNAGFEAAFVAYRSFGNALMVAVKSPPETA